MTIPNTPRSIFISYAHADNENDDPKKRWLDRFLKFLTPFVRQEDYIAGSDRDVLIGEDWHERLQAHLAGAKAAVLMVSPDFLASRYITDREIPILLRQSAEAGLKIFPIIISPCSYERTTFKYPDPNTGPCELELSSFQAANPPTRTLVDMDEGAQNRVLANVAEQLADLLADPDQPVVHTLPPKWGVVGEKAPPIRPLLRCLELAINGGDLKDSELGPSVYAAIAEERRLELAKPFDAKWLIAGIVAGDNFFAPIRLSAGQRDWQRDFAQNAAPILVGVTWSLDRSPDAQAVVIRLCNVLAKQLRLTIIWPDDPDDSNDLKNAIYRACIGADELESDDVLRVLHGLKIIGPE